MSKIKKIVFSALMLALLIIVSRFLSIKTPLLMISFGFIPIMITAIYCGPQYSTIVAGLGDFIGAILFPFGTYFVGFTISAAISGFIYGIFLHKKQDKFLLMLILSSIIVLGIVNIFLNSLWLNIMYGDAYIVVVSTRILAQLIMLPIQVVIIYAMEKELTPFVNKYLC